MPGKRTRPSLPRRIERTVAAPDGRVWTLHTLFHRFPPPPEEDDPYEQYGRRLSRAVPFIGPLLLPVVRLFRLVGAPVIESTVMQRPWVRATSTNPPETLFWQSTGRESAAVVVEEIADALARGDDRPHLLYSVWVGHQGSLL